MINRATPFHGTRSAGVGAEASTRTWRSDEACLSQRRHLQSVAGFMSPLDPNERTVCLRRRRSVALVISFESMAYVMRYSDFPY
jgi:hypothetical protein